MVKQLLIIVGIAMEIVRNTTIPKKERYKYNKCMINSQRVQRKH